MEFHTSQGKKEFPDGKSVKFKELEISTGHSVRITIRIYPSNTFVTYLNDYKHIAKVLYKAPHSDAQKSMGDWLEKTFSRMRLRVGGQEFVSVMSMYWKLVKEPII